MKTVFSVERSLKGVIIQKVQKYNTYKKTSAN